MPDLIDILESFNRKERFFLISHALNGRLDKPAFTPNVDFLKELCNKVDAPVPEKTERVFVAMDYHLEWLYAGLTKWNESDVAKWVFGNPGEGAEQPIQGDIEDIDLLIAFKHGGQYHLILVEAKAYNGKRYASFERAQLKSKAERLVKMFGETGQKCAGVTAYFCLLSQNPPQPLAPYAPPWNESRWMPAALPRRDTRRIVERCNENGEVAAHGNHFSVKFLTGE